MVQLVMNRHNLGPDHGESLDVIFRPYPIDKRLPQLSAAEACIIDN